MMSKQILADHTSHSYTSLMIRIITRFVQDNFHSMCSCRCDPVIRHIIVSAVYVLCLCTPNTLYNLYTSIQRHFGPDCRSRPRFLDLQLQAEDMKSNEQALGIQTHSRLNELTSRDQLESCRGFQESNHRRFMAVPLGERITLRICLLLHRY